ncbi:chemotaxis signal transduction protein [Citrobacter koseri]|uniref:Chemotaxis signal transduction protein n=1 Tax=Citrobacter koseri TaxID=545 RepID=A0A447UI93_CITKO|nr:chemotaxis signal transduction protein [Citrobacter koseri]
MDNFQKDIDDRANLTLSNRFELLLFRLGTSLHEQKSELFGIKRIQTARNCANAHIYAPCRNESPAFRYGQHPRSGDPGHRPARRGRV